MIKKGKKRIIIFIVAAFWVGWIFFVVSYNYKVKKADLVPVENYQMGEYVPFGNNYSYGYDLQGFDIKVNDYIIEDTSEYLEENELSANDFSYLTDKICSVNINVRYNGERKEALFDTMCFWMFGTDYYESMNDELYVVANPKSNGATRIVFRPGDECSITLVYNLNREYYTNDSWKHIEDLRRAIYLTANPIQKNVILHE